MTVSPEDRVTAFIAADPDSVWDMVSDVTRMGQWSPEPPSDRRLGSR